MPENLIGLGNAMIMPLRLSCQALAKIMAKTYGRLLIYAGNQTTGYIIGISIS
jgi:hypothetical protein